MPDRCGACCGGGFYSTVAGTLGDTVSARRVRCIECGGTGVQSAHQQAIVDALNARVKARTN